MPSTALLSITDVDECTGNSHQCLGNSTCRNRQGGYKCICSGQSIGPNKECLGENSSVDV